MKSSGLTGGVRWVRAGLSAVGETGTPGVAVYVAKLQNKQQLKQLQDEHKLQREFIVRKYVLFRSLLVFQKILVVTYVHLVAV